MVRYLQNTLEYTNYTFHVPVRSNDYKAGLVRSPQPLVSFVFIIIIIISPLSPWSSSLYTFTFGHQPSVDMVTKLQRLFISVPSNDTRSNTCHVQIFNKNKNKKTTNERGLLSLVSSLESVF